MKKLFTLTFMFILSCAMSFAQGAFEFVDNAGNVIPNGTVFYANGHFEDWGGLYEKDSGIFIKGNGAVTMKVEIKKFVEGMEVMCCPGGSCAIITPDAPLEKDLTVSADKLLDIATHVSYEDGVSGTCELELTLINGGNVSSKITLVFVTHDLSGIESVIANNALCNIYDITGKLVKTNVNKNTVYSMNKGLYIVRELTGAKNVNKVIVK